MRRGGFSVRRRTLLFGLLLVLLAIPGQGFAAGGSSGSARGPKPSAKHGDAVTPHVFTGDLRDLPKNGKAKKGKPEFKEPDFGAQKQTTQAAPAVPKPTREMPAPSTSFKGLDFVGGGSAGYPPDTVGDVGPNHYIEAVNTAFAVYSKTGTQLAATTFDNFFSGTNTLCDNNNFGDPTVVYDPMADRWIVADFAFIYDQATNTTPPPFYECIGVSRTSDPVAGGWYQYAIRTDDAAHPWLHDYPKMGIWPDGLYMSGNEFDANGNYEEVRLWAFNRGDLESGAAVRNVVIDLGGPAYFGLLPGNMRGTLPPANSPNYFVSEDEQQYAFDVWKFHPDYNNPNASTFTGPTNVDQTVYTVAPLNVPVPSPGDALDSLRERLMMQAQYRNINGVESLWVNHTINSGSNATDPVGIQWAQINVTGGNVNTTPVQQQIYGNLVTNGVGDGIGRWMGSLAVDKNGDMALGYSAASLTTAPDLRYAGRLAGDPLNTLAQGEATLLGGVSRGVQVGIDRWGDYSAMTIDPDGCTFWYVGEYYDASSTSNWQTRIGSFKYPSCTSTPSTINWAAQDSVDFNNDHITDLGALYRGLSPQDSLWFAPGTFQIYFGATTDIPVPGDYDGDKKAEAVIFREGTGLWYGPKSSGGLFQLPLGQTGDVPIPGYYDNNLTMDPAIYRKSTGLWFALLSGGGTSRIDGLGLSTDVPVQKRPTLAGGQ